MIRRVLPIVALTLGVLASIGLVVAVAPGGSSGYVSETGVPDGPYARLYQVSVLAVALAAGVLAVAVRPVLAWGALALAVASPTIALSAVVACTTGCPLPPYEPTTARDLVHGVASVVGVGCCALAMLALAWRPGPLQRIARVAMAVGWPILLGTAISIVVVGRGAVTGALERIGLAVCLLWIVAVSARLARSSPSR